MALSCKLGMHDYRHYNMFWGKFERHCLDCDKIQYEVFVDGKHIWKDYEQGERKECIDKAKAEKKIERDIREQYARDIQSDKVEDACSDFLC